MCYRNLIKYKHICEKGKLLIKLHVYYTFLLDICYNSIYYSLFINRKLLKRKKEELNGKKEGSLHRDRKSTRLNSSHVAISYAVFCLKKKITHSKHGRENNNST